MLLNPKQSSSVTSSPGNMSSRNCFAERCVEMKGIGDTALFNWPLIPGQLDGSEVKILFSWSWSLGRCLGFLGYADVIKPQVLPKS